MTVFNPDLKPLLGSWRLPGLQVSIDKQSRVVAIEDRKGRFLGVCPHCDRTWWQDAGERIDERFRIKHKLTPTCIDELVVLQHRKDASQ